ncbi:hypothetical protein RUND412_003130 [Rhizina undulata]
MLRRKPTAIKLTADDLKAYDSQKKTRDEAAALARVKSEEADANVLTPVGNVGRRTREERIGLGGGR